MNAQLEPVDEWGVAQQQSSPAVGPLALRFLGVGGHADPVNVGSPAAVVELKDKPELLIDCGPETVDRFATTYQRMPDAIFITHPHFDHIGGLETLFYRLATQCASPSLVRLFVPATVIPLLCRKLISDRMLLAEGGRNFFDCFQLIPVTTGFWHSDRWYDVFEVRHHHPGFAYGLCLRTHFVYTGDTRPIPEALRHYGARNEVIFHDCGERPNPSHTGLSDLAREYDQDIQSRLVLYHYGSSAARQRMIDAGYRVAVPARATRV